MQEVAQLYTSMPRDVSSWCMPISWQVPQEGNNVSNFIGMILLFNWTHGCHILFLVLNLEYYLKTLPLELAFVYLIYLVNSFSCKVFVRCKCQTLKKEWFCQDVQAAHRNAGSDPRDIPKNQYGIGLLPCNSACKSKVQVVDSELHSRKSKVMEVISFEFCQNFCGFLLHHLFWLAFLVVWLFWTWKAVSLCLVFSCLLQD